MRAVPLVASAAGALLTLASPARAEEPPRLELSLGLDRRTLGAGSMAFDRLRQLRDTAGQTGALPATASAAPPSAEVSALALRATGDLAPHVYGGLDLSVGRAELYDPSLDAAGLSVSPGVYYAAGGVAGMVAAAGPLRARAELFAGVQAVHFGVDVERTESRRLFSQAIEPVLEPRAAAELSFGPLALGARAGTDLIRRGDLVLGLYVALSWPL